jgi:hypothetical protein
MQDTVVDETPRTLRDGRFVLLEAIGEGAQGRTFDGVDNRPPQGRPRAVAIKRFDVRGAASWKDVELAEREARVLQSLSFPKLPAYVDHFEEDGALYLVMEKIEGESLGALRKRGAVLGEDGVVRLLRDASDTLDYLHGRAPPVIHRDLKPGNVLLRPDGSFAFVDFGAVRDKLRPRGGSTVVGTFGYMAPEQVQGRALPASDVYAIGATALAMLTGCEPEELPHRGLAIDVREALRGTARSRPARGGGGTRASTGLVEVLERMLEPEPDRRASRIAPLLARLDARGARGPGNGREASSERRADRPGRHTGRRERRAARRAERAARRARRWRSTRGHSFFPWPARFAFALLFTLGTVAVSLATQVVVPTVLRLLSLFFARRSLIAAAEAVRDAGDTAVQAMDRSRRWFEGEFRGEVVPPVAEPSVQSRVRVSADAPSRLDDAGRTRVAGDNDGATAMSEEEEGSASRASRAPR